MPRRVLVVRAGQRFGRLMVIRERELFPQPEPRVLVCCDCGDRRTGWTEPRWVYVSELRRRTNPLRSCGCYGREVGDRNLTARPSFPGERNPSARLTGQQVKEIRARLAAGERQRAVWEAYGISRSQLQRIRRGESWTAAS